MAQRYEKNAIFDALFINIFYLCTQTKHLNIIAYETVTTCNGHGNSC